MSDPKVMDNSNDELSPATSHMEDETAESAKNTRRSFSKSTSGKRKNLKVKIQRENKNQTMVLVMLRNLCLTKIRTQIISNLVIGLFVFQEYKEKTRALIERRSYNDKTF